MIEINGADCEKPECKEALEALYLFLDKELSNLKRSQVQEHLDDCLPCLQAFEFEVELKRVIAHKCTEEVPSHLYERVRKSLKLEIKKISE